MALKSTIFKAELSVADIDRGYYRDHGLTIAQHPPRLTVPVFAFALHFVWTQPDGESMCKLDGERGSGEKMAFRFGREQTIGRCLMKNPLSYRSARPESGREVHNRYLTAPLARIQNKRRRRLALASGFGSSDR
jgi:hypothetical protein